MIRPAARVDLFNFTNYRSYFQNLAADWTDSGASMQSLAKHCGFTSPNFVQQLIAGKRRLTEGAAQKVAIKLNFKASERQYLLALVRLERAKDADDLSYVMRSMKRLIGQAKRQPITDTTIYDHWLYGVVFEMFKLKRVNTPDELVKIDLRIGVPTQQLQAAFEFLAQRGYLKEKMGKWSTAEVDFKPQNDVRRINSQQNHLKFFSFAQHRINDELQDREFQGLTFAASEARLPELKERIRAFLKTINDEFAEDHDGDQVLRLQLGLFKLLK